MNERRQPIVKGTDARGELIWGSEPMALWQCLMFPLKYCGDFATFWMKRAMLVNMGYEVASEVINADFEIKRFGPVAKERRNTGD